MVTGTTCTRNMTHYMQSEMGRGMRACYHGECCMHSQLAMRYELQSLHLTATGMGPATAVSVLASAPAVAPDRL